ncbi:MAG: hypothetical protein JNN18_19585 [Rubrivivax sp.]|jgi:hypothetical protein|nr:hypothetical protein [Rubrivivax sp.]
MAGGFTKTWVKTLDNALKAGVPAEQFKGIQAFGTNLEKAEEAMLKMGDLREQIEKDWAEFEKLRKVANTYIPTIQSQSKLYRKASEGMESAYKKLGDKQTAEAASMLRAGLDCIDAMTDKNVNLSFDCKITH